MNSILGLVKWDLWWKKWRLGRFFPSTSVSPANRHSTKLSIIIITRGRYNRPVSGRRAEWTQLDSTPHYANLKKIILIYVYIIYYLPKYQRRVDIRVIPVSYS
jgi:hypothetical protein